MSDPDGISLDYLLVADGADAVGGKLYLLGGGWDRLMVPQLPGPPAVPFAVALGINVPWNLTNRKIGFRAYPRRTPAPHDELLIGRPYDPRSEEQPWDSSITTMAGASPIGCGRRSSPSCRPTPRLRIRSAATAAGCRTEAR